MEVVRGKMIVGRVRGGDGFILSCFYFVVRTGERVIFS